MTADDRDRGVLAEWWRAIEADPAKLPEGVDLVQSRLVRAVGRGTLPSGTAAFLKVMGFPRRKDQLRYLFRSLPARHEAAMLRFLAVTTDIPAPEVLFVAGSRRLRLPRACLLVTKALPVAPRELEPDPVLNVVYALRDAGVFHPDLHSDNFVPLQDGRVAVLDLQSARVRRLITRRDFARMLTTLIAHRAFQGVDIRPWCEALRKRGHDNRTVRRMEQLAHRVNARSRLTWIERCTQESTQFKVRNSLGRSLVERRDLAGQGEWIEGGEEMFRYWMGDRALEILAGGTPILGALDRPRVGSGAHRLELVGGAAALTENADRLLGGYEKYRELKSRKL